MSRLDVISTLEAPAKINVVFLHGLGGDGTSSWQNQSGQFLPRWIAEELENTGVYSIDYDASPSKWLGTAMPLFDRASELIELLRLRGVFGAPTVFVAHSMGGIIAKKMLQLAMTQGQREWDEVAASFRGIVFLSTPHSGANIASFLKALNTVFALRLSDATLNLEKNSAQLRELSIWFRNQAASSRLRTRVYYEKQKTHGILVVDEGTADPGLPGIILTPIDANHISISKPERGSTVHLGIIDLIRSALRDTPTAPVDDETQRGLKEVSRRDYSSVVNILQDTPPLLQRALELFNSPRFPTVMSISEEVHLVPNPVWDKYVHSEKVSELPVVNRLRGHMFLSVVQPRGKHPHLKCYFATSWGACLIPFLKHPKNAPSYLDAVNQHAVSHYRGRASPTGKSLVSIKRNEQYKGELWLYSFEFYSLVLPNDYQQDDDHRWLDLERLSDERHPESAVNGDIIRALREHFGTGFHGVERSDISVADFRLGDF